MHAPGITTLWSLRGVSAQLNCLPEVYAAAHIQRTFKSNTDFQRFKIRTDLSQDTINKLLACITYGPTSYAGMMCVTQL